MLNSAGVVLAVAATQADCTSRATLGVRSYVLMTESSIQSRRIRRAAAASSSCCLGISGSTMNGTSTVPMPVKPPRSPENGFLISSRHGETL